MQLETKFQLEPTKNELFPIYPSFKESPILTTSCIYTTLPKVSDFYTWRC